MTDQELASLQLQSVCSTLNSKPNCLLTVFLDLRISLANFAFKFQPFSRSLQKFVISVCFFKTLYNKTIYVYMVYESIYKTRFRLRHVSVGLQRVSHKDHTFNM